jgi:hypothetical protein
VTAHTRGRDIKAIRINFELRIHARDYFGHDVPMVLIVERIEDSHAVTNTDARRWL